MNYKKLLATLILILAVLPVSAQLIPFSLEVRGGINRSEPSIKHGDVKEVFSYRADALLDYKMGLGLFTRTGLTFTEKNAKESDLKMKAQYLEIPAMVGYKLSIPMIGSINVAGGMYFAYGVGGKSDVYSTSSNVISNDKIKTFDKFYKRFDTGLAVSAGVEYSRVTLNVGYEHGLMNVAKHDGNIKNRSIYASLGFRIL